MRREASAGSRRKSRGSDTEPGRPGRDGDAIDARLVAPGGARPRRSLGSSSWSDSSYGRGFRSRRPTHSATGTLTALPTSFQRCRSPRRPSSPAGAVQSASKPCILSASRMSGVTIRPSGIQIAGGEGIPIVEPPFSVGTPSTAHPRPRIPRSSRTRTLDRDGRASPARRGRHGRGSRADQQSAMPAGSPAAAVAEARTRERRPRGRPSGTRARRACWARIPHRVAPVELEHEWDVLQQQPPRRVLGLFE